MLQRHRCCEQMVHMLVNFRKFSRHELVQCFMHPNPLLSPGQTVLCCRLHRLWKSIASLHLAAYRDKTRKAPFLLYITKSHLLMGHHQSPIFGRFLPISVSLLQSGSVLFQLNFLPITCGDRLNFRCSCAVLHPDLNCFSDFHFSNGIREFTVQIND